MAVSDYHIAAAVVLSNDREIKTKRNVLYLPIYHLMFFGERKYPKEKICSSESGIVFSDLVFGSCLLPIVILVIWF